MTDTNNIEVPIELIKNGDISAICISLRMG